jgi:copper chaperone CopZ
MSDVHDDGRVWVIVKGVDGVLQMTTTYCSDNITAYVPSAKGTPTTSRKQQDLDQGAVTVKIEPREYL